MSTKDTVITSYQKDFQDWHAVKTDLNNQPEKNKPYFYEREIWWTSIGKNVGFEEDGKNEKFTRPVLVLRKFNKYTFLGVPLSTSKIINKYRIPFKYKDDVESTALISQLRVYDSNRLGTKDGTIPEADYKNIQAKITELINERAQK